MEIQEQHIIDKLRSGDESGLRLLFDLYYSPLSVFAFKYFDSFEKAEDVVQEVFIDLWEMKRFKNFTGSVKSYLFTAVKNNSLKQIQKDKRFRFEDIENLSYKIIEDKFESQELEARKERLYKEIELLPLQSKKVFEAIVFERLKYADIAVELNISVNTVKTHYSRALKHLRSSMDILIMIMLA
ncbi:RNA polymerase sigma-70 factor [Ancylomarina euxinus]|uniref:RNA polymerase sigma-70 factor n=1 Tax=Ancylomarina euxinus TaxID=2283627 RepID=A0A425XYZ9_9BACT|nr:RNA polymerase sigma-70 factor [Ancylomarina euxinus]MCZ4695563.1 RNA polymerase sigma-70 factor [Ancylomarina euxinus]MUP15944.1 RNA polymerase sigma-70 factor [Ancylomarina euxinus]RRG20385.1 RNA polymerase sigma-70 factor [Ancylomarina euxinus]